MPKIDNKFVWELTRKLDLPFGTVRSLLVHGWSYQEFTDQPARWVAPATQLKRLRK